MSIDLLSVELHCPDNPGCTFIGADIAIDVVITNQSQQVIGVPISYIRKTGPIVQLVDTASGRETYLKKNLAAVTLKNEFTPLRPGQSETAAWVITSSEIEQFGRPVDLSATATVSAVVQVGGEPLSFLGSSTVRIVEHQKEQ